MSAISTTAKNNDRPMAEIEVRWLLKSSIVMMHDTYCRGTCRHPSVEEETKTTQLVFPYRGVYVRHVGDDQTIAEANQVLFFNAAEGYKVSHPVTGGDASLTLILEESQLRELVPRALLREGSRVSFRPNRLRIDAPTQVLVALLRHRLREGISEPLEAESLALTLVQRSLGPWTAKQSGASYGRKRLVDRVKLVLASDVARRWTLTEIAAEVKGSPVYLTQVFQQVEGVPLYRYQLNLRLSRALDLLGEYEDLTSLGLDLGFSSHSHFSAAFRRFYGLTPSAFKKSALSR
jgi:AraC family transcriptional regulator